MLRLIPPEYSDLTDYEMSNTLFPHIVIWCSTSDEIDWGYDSDVYDKVYESTINGMPAFVFDDNIGWECSEVTFGNADMSVRGAGTEFTLDEVIAVAENVTW